jgi:hypothetical protein
MMMKIHIVVLWIMEMFSRFERIYCLHLQGKSMMWFNHEMETVKSTDIGRNG